MKQQPLFLPCGLETQGVTSTRCDPDSTIKLRSGYQIRSYFGYYQSRSSSNERWQFQVCGFDSTSSGVHGQCTVLMADDTETWAPIDEVGRILIHHQWFSREHWQH